MSLTNIDHNTNFDFSNSFAEVSINSYLANVFTTSNSNIPDLTFPSILPNPTISIPNGSFSMDVSNKHRTQRKISPFEMISPLKTENRVEKEVLITPPAPIVPFEGNHCLSILPVLPETVQQYCDITEFLNLPQNQAAKKLRIPPSTLSKRWKEASRNRKWPWRTVRKIDKEITCLLHNVPPTGSIPEGVESHLSVLLKKRQDELRPVVIRI